MPSRVAFQGHWNDLRTHPFDHQAHPAFHRLKASLEALYSRCEQPIPSLKNRPVRLSVKLLSPGEAGRTLFTLGVKTKSHGSWAFSLGACPTRGISFGITGWQIIVNATNPWEERLPLEGFDNRDWHTFVFSIPNAKGPAQLYCDGQFVMALREPIMEAQRNKVAEDQNPRHGSIQQLVPETFGVGEYAFVESRHPGQTIDIDRFEISQAPLVTSRTSLPVLQDLDWELDGTRRVENTLKRFEGNPVLKKKEIPDPSEKNSGGSFVRVLKGGSGFQMFFAAVHEMSQAIGRTTFGIYRASSDDGLRWQMDPKQAVLTPGEEGSWDEGSLGQMAVLKEGDLFRMWYGGYVARLQQGRAGYAESNDGIRWTKPTLGFFPFAGKPTNICFPLQPGFNSNEYELPADVVRDEQAPPERRYTMFLHTQGPHGFIVDVATSRDGKRFVRAPQNARHYAFDPVPRNSTLHGAAVVLHEPNYWWAFVGHHEAERRGYRMRFTGWVVEPEESENVGFGLWRSTRVHLEPDPQAWDRSDVHVGSFLEVGDEWWVYYACEGNFGLAKVGRHRMFGIELVSGVESGYVTTIGLRPPKEGWKHHNLALNASGLTGGGHLQVELVDVSAERALDGFKLDDCLPIESDGLALPVRWRKTGTILPDSKEPLRLRITMNRGSQNPQLHGVYLRKA
ncbi:MAG: hypothetical protein FJW26_11065 [Acidimicrobiia bacterium]|nr:hypothetical protein [Acidimicrobiia bacterium]